MSSRIMECGGGLEWGGGSGSIRRGKETLAGG